MSIYPKYEKSDPTEQRIQKCIEHELNHGGNAMACARAIMRDIHLAHIEPLDKAKGINCAPASTAASGSEAWSTAMHMPVIEIIKAHLTEIGADGLCTHDCGCGLDDLAPCCGWIGDCVPARAVTSGIGPDGGAWTDEKPWYAPMEENQ